MAISGDLAVVGAPLRNGAGLSRGAVYAFDLASGTEQAILTASDAEDGDIFGDAVAMTDALGIVGAPRKPEGGSQRGAAYVFELGTETPSLPGTPSLSISPGGAIELIYDGVPGLTYGIQRSEELVDWEQIAVLTANPSGELFLLDPDPPSPRAFYRVFLTPE